MPITAMRAAVEGVPGVLKAMDVRTVRRAMRVAWSIARLYAARAVRWFSAHPYTAWGLLYGTLGYLGLALLIGMPGRAILALMIVGPTAWWCFRRWTAYKAAQSVRLGFFGPLLLNEDILSSKVVYCVGLRNEGAKAVANVRVNIDLVDGHPRPTLAMSLPIFHAAAGSTALQPGEAEYFCVARTVDGTTEDEGAVAICCHDNLVAPRFRLLELADGKNIALSASGDGASTTTQRIRIFGNREAAGTARLQLRLLPGADETPPQVVGRALAAPLRADDSGTRLRSEDPAAPQRPEDSVPRPLAEEPVAHPLAEVPVARPLAEGPVARPPTEDPAPQPRPDEAVAPPPTEESSPHSERVRRLLARQALRTGSK